MQDAGSDEAEFHRVFTALRNDLTIDAEAAIDIAFAYTGERFATRESALGGIETAFYQQREQQQQEQTAAREGARR